MQLSFSLHGLILTGSQRPAWSHLYASGIRLVRESQLLSACFVANTRDALLTASGMNDVFLHMSESSMLLYYLARVPCLVSDGMKR